MECFWSISPSQEPAPATIPLVFVFKFHTYLSTYPSLCCINLIFDYLNPRAKPPWPFPTWQDPAFQALHLGFKTNFFFFFFGLGPASRFWREILLNSSSHSLCNLSTSASIEGTMSELFSMLRCISTPRTTDMLGCQEEKASTASGAQLCPLCQPFL